MPKCDFNKVRGSSPVNLLHIFRTPFPKNTFGWMFLYVVLGATANCVYLFTCKYYSFQYVDKTGET